jgi:hypothetical protein
MVDASLLPAITETIRQNEIGAASPYVLGFARLGKSGASFGFMQGDTNVSPLARATLAKVLAAAAMAQADIDRIMAALSQALPDGNPLSDADTAAVNAALASDSGRPLVDQMDQTLMQGVLKGLDGCIAAAASDGMTLDPIVNLYIAPWINMTGTPTLLKTWLAGAAVMGVPAPTPPKVKEADIVAYLQATSYFQAHPRNFAHLEQCVAAGAALLPPAAP